MPRELVGSVFVVMLSLAASVASGEPRRGGGGRAEGGRSESERFGGERSSERSDGERSRGQTTSGRKPPGGAWSEYNHAGNGGGGQFRNSHNESGAEGAAAGAAHSNRNSSQASGAEGAAAGATASNRNNPKYSGAQGAGAGAAAANRNNPKYSGAQGAGAGAAAANRNNPQYSGAQGAAAAGAAAKRNNPNYSGAQGAAAGAAAANRNAPKYSGAQGAAAGAAVANNNAPQYSGAAGAAAGYAAVRNNLDHPGMYSPQWYGEHQTAWTPGDWRGAGAWAQPTWKAVANQFNYDIDVTPVPYNYGSNVTCINNNVIVNGQPVGTAEEFSQQADELAETGTAASTSPDDKWLPLGVFALVRNEQQHPQLIMQLAVNQQGIVRGNYTDDVTDSTLPVHGAVDPKTQRAAWTVGDNRYSVMEAGLNNLTQNEAPALVHKNGTTQKWLLVRLTQPSEGSDSR